MLTHLTKNGEYKEIIEECNESVKTGIEHLKICKEKQIKLYKKNFKNGALFLWNSLQESELPYEDYEEMREYIVNLFLEEK